MGLYDYGFCVIMKSDCERRVDVEMSVQGRDGGSKFG